MAQYFSLYSWLFSTIVHLGFDNSSFCFPFSQLMTKITYVITILVCALICVNQLDATQEYVAKLSTTIELPLFRMAR